MQGFFSGIITTILALALLQLVGIDGTVWLTQAVDAVAESLAELYNAAMETSA